MRPAAIPAILSAVLLAWRDAFRALDRMRNLGLAVLVILLFMEVAQAMVLAACYDPKQVLGFSEWIAGLAHEAIGGVLLAPFAIAVHRFVLLDERAARYRIDPVDGRFLRFTFYLMLMAALGEVPNLLALASALVRSSFGLPVIFLLCILCIVVTIITVRVVILFPAVAVDAADPSWQRAVEDTKGHSWHVFFVLLISMLPIIVATDVLYRSVALVWSVSPLAWAVLTGLGSATVELVGMAVLVAAASRLYQALGRSSRQPAGVAV